MQSASRHILCVDDEPDTCAVLKALFEHAGHRVTTAASPCEALTLVERETFDLYVLDTRFPAASGIELCHTLRARLPAVPAIFYSGASNSEEQEAGIAAGAAVYVPKPHIEELIKVVQRQLDNLDNAAN